MSFAIPMPIRSSTGTRANCANPVDKVLELAQRNLITIYGMSTVAFGFNSEGEQNLKRLAEDTGWRVEYPLQGLYSDVSGFLSTPSDEGNYALKVGTGQYAAAIARGIFESIAAIAGRSSSRFCARVCCSAFKVSAAFEWSNTCTVFSIRCCLPANRSSKRTARRSIARVVSGSTIVNPARGQITGIGLPKNR